jgi:hypothetical protein
MTLYDNFSRGTLVFHAASIASPIFYQKSDASDMSRDIFAGSDMVMPSEGSPTWMFCSIADAIVGYTSERSALRRRRAAWSLICGE